jgi:hypothetical protein
MDRITTEIKVENIEDVALKRRGKLEGEQKLIPNPKHNGEMILDLLIFLYRDKC